MRKNFPTSLFILRAIFQSLFFQHRKWFFKKIDNLEKKYNDCMRKKFPTSLFILRAKIQPLFFTNFFIFLFRKNS